MAASARANESRNTLIITAIANCEEILSSHTVEANTSHCVIKVMSLRPCSHDNVFGANPYRSVVVLWFVHTKTPKNRGK